MYINYCKYIQQQLYGVQLYNEGRKKIDKKYFEFGLQKRSKSE